MGQLQKVSWRTAGYAALGTVVAAASVVAVINSDGVRPTSLTSSAATRWLVDQVNETVVLVDGLAGRVVAKIAIESESDTSGEVAVQGAGGAFLVAASSASVRTISTAKLQLGTAQAVSLLAEPDVEFGVGASGLTVVSPRTNEASVIAVDDVTRPVKVPESNRALVAADGSMWLLGNTEATHVNIDESATRVTLRGTPNQTATIGSDAVSYDANSQTVSWLDGGDVSVQSIANASEAVLQESGDDAPCVWLGVGETLVCVGATGITTTIRIEGMSIAPDDRLAVAGNAMVIVHNNNEVDRIDLDDQRLGSEPRPDPPASPPLSITASGNLIWLDDQSGENAWVAHRFGINPITKNDESVPLLDAQGQIKDLGISVNGPITAGGDTSGEDDTDHLDENGVDDPPVAVDDSVTARAGSTITIPVTGNDYDPDGDAIAVVRVGVADTAGHGATDVLNGTSVAYRPELGFSGTDSFTYTIVDEHGGEDTATVNVELFPPGSPNRPPIARPDEVNTRLGRAVTIDVLANDIDPERDMLTVPTFQDDSGATITDTLGPTDLPALKYQPPNKPGVYTFTYQAADPQGGTSQQTVVTVTVSAADAENNAPVARPDAIRLPVGVVGELDVKANDIDPDGDDLRIGPASGPPGVTAVVLSQLLKITLGPGAPDRSLVTYKLTDGDPLHDATGKVLVLKIDEAAENRAPVANADAERVVIGNSVKITVTANDADPEDDELRLVSVGTPEDGVGTTAVEGNSVRFTPNLPDITEPTPVTFPYTISDTHGNEATGTVTVTVLVEALPRAPFARDDFADTVTNKSVNIDALANDGDPSGGRPSLIGTPTCAGGGVASITADNRITFVPPSGQTGVYRCKYSVSNAQGLLAEATIIVTVAVAPPGNRPPTVDNSAPLKTVGLGKSITISANDMANDDDGDSLVFSAVSKPTRGTTSFSDKTESFSYTAPDTGTADRTPEVINLDVTISDGNDGNVSTTISVRVVDDSPLPPTTPPVARDIPHAAFTGDNVAIDVVAELRDQNSTTQLTLTSASLDSGPGTVSTLGPVVGVKTTGPGTVVVSYTVTNSDDIPASAKIRITVTDPPPANPPVAVDDVLTIASGGVNSVDLLINDSGISDPGDVVSAVLLNRPPTSFGTVELLRGVLTFVAAPNAAGVAVIRYSLSDDSGLSSTATITLNVLPCSESPPSAPAATLFTPYQVPIAIDLTQYVLSGSIRAGSVVGGGLTGTSGIYTPPAGMNGIEVVTFIVENGCQQSTQGQLSIDVNRAPVGGSISKVISRGSTLTVTVAELASDDEPLDIVALNGSPSWVTLVPGNSGSPGSFDDTTINASPPTGTSAHLPYAFTAVVQDPGGLTASATITLTISNIGPTAIADQYFTEFSSLPFNPTENDIDPESGPLVVQTAAVTSGSAEIQSITGNTIVVTLGHGISTLTYTVRDDGGLTSSSTITITSNRLPTIQPGTEDTDGHPTAHLPLTITEPDGDPVTVTCAPPDGFGYAILVDPTPSTPPDPFNPEFKLVVSVPSTFNNDPFNSVMFPCTVIDELGGTATATITITV